jgi:hypothetical protein
MVCIGAGNRIRAAIPTRFAHPYRRPGSRGYDPRRKRMAVKMNETTSRRCGPLRLVVLACLALIAAAPVTKEMSPDIAMPILGRTVYSPKGDTVGRLVDVLVDAAGLPQAAVLDVGGFLGVGNRVIAVHWAALHFHPTDKDHPIVVDMPADEIAAAPQYTDTTAPAQVVVQHATPAPPSAPVAVPAPAAPAAAPSAQAGAAGTNK